jgi:hypothetical protein
MPRPKKFVRRKKNVKIVKEPRKQIGLECHEKPNQSRDRAMHEGDNL